MKHKFEDVIKNFKNVTFFFPIIICLHRCAQLNGFGQHGALTIFAIILLQDRYYFYFTSLETEAPSG